MKPRRGTARTFWNEPLETLSARDLARLRLDKLRRQLAYCARRAPFFADRFRAAGIDPDRIRSLRHWAEFSILMDKQAIREGQDATLDADGHAFGTHLCAPLKRVVNVYATSGTTGTPAFYCFTRADFRINAELVKRAFWRAGLRPGDSILWAWGLGAFVATSMLPALGEMGVRVVPVGAEAGTERLVNFARLTGPKTLVGTPSLLTYLIESVPALTGKPVSHLGFRRIVTGSEPGAGLPDIRKRILEAYDGPAIYDLYGPANQFSFLSCGTETYHGMHVVGGDFGIWDDLVDPIGNEPVEVKDGAVGNMILTELQKQAAPYIRYAMNDIIQVSIGECECGLKGPRIRVVGRADDMLIVKGVNIFPAAIQNLVAGFVPSVTGALRIHLDRPPPLVTPPLRLTLERGAATADHELAPLARKIAAKMQALLHVKPEIRWVAAGALGRSGRKTPLLVRDDLQPQAPALRQP